MRPISLSASTLTGDRIRNLDGDKLGHLEEIVIDLEGGRISYAVLSSGGFLGLGDKLFAIPWDMLTVDTDNREIILDVSKESLENAPGFDKDNWPDVHDRTWVGDVYRYYGSEPYWERDTLETGRHEIDDLQEVESIEDDDTIEEPV